MASFKLRKGNFFNQLTNSFDPRIIDGNQYDLEFTLNNASHYYRVRFVDGEFFVKEVFIDKEEFVSPAQQKGCTMPEITSFLSSRFYARDFEYKNLIEREKQLLISRKIFDSQDYYRFLSRIEKKKNVSGISLYDFTLPAVGARSKDGVISYDVSVECSKKYYYAVFFKELVERGYYQSTKDLYMIYLRPDFNREKDSLEKDILSLAIANNYPVNLTSWLYLITDGNKELIADIFKDIRDTKLKGPVSNILLSKHHDLLYECFLHDEDLEDEFYRFMFGEQQDINYNFSRKRHL